jgi:hypothetical protein
MNPTITKKKWKKAEDIQLAKLAIAHDCRWAKIASIMQPRTEH